MHEASAGVVTEINKKIIYIAFMPLTEKIHREWFVDFLRTKGHDVEYWNLSPFLNGLKGDGDLQEAKFNRRFFSFSEFETALGALSNDLTVCVMLMGYGERFVPVYRLLTKYRCRMVYLAWGYVPWRREREWKEKVVSLLSPRKFVKRAFFKLRAVVYRKLGLVEPYDIVFSSSPTIAATRFDAKKIVQINSSDYDRFVENDDVVDLKSPKPYAVFLDIFLPYQSDLTFSGVQKVDPERYYSSLNRFFDLIEHRHDVRIVIAAHPKARYAADQFNGREIVSGKTPALVKQASFAISHNSTSISFAILAHKPTIFVYTQEMFELYRHTVVADMEMMSEFLGASINNIDKLHDYGGIDIRPPDLDRYEAYKRQFLGGAGGGNVPARDVFYREIRGLFAQ